MTIRPIKVSIEITGKCNLKCDYCCRGYLNSPDKILTEITTKDILSIINQAKEEGCKSFLFIGGEPFVNPDFSEILFNCKGYFIEVFSNGTLLSNPQNLYLVKKYVSRLTITLDGLSAHNFYRKGSNYLEIIKNIKRVKEECPKTVIKINTLINRHSIEELLLLYPILKEIKVDEWHIDFPQLRGRLSELEESFSANYERIGVVLKQLLKEFYKDNCPFYLKIYKIFNSKITDKNILESSLEENPCAYKTNFSMFVSAEGQYLLCPSIPSGDILLGDIKNQTFKEIILKKDILSFNKIKIKDLKKCTNCKYFSLCLGGCRGEAKILSGSFFLPDLNACSLMNMATKYIYPNLPDEKREVYMKRIDFSKETPPSLKCLDELKIPIRN